jgi:hypothetical protein
MHGTMNIKSLFTGTFYFNLRFFLPNGVYPVGVSSKIQYAFHKHFICMIIAASPNFTTHKILSSALCLATYFIMFPVTDAEIRGPTQKNETVPVTLSI